jgi:hypothetical protein
MTLFELSKRIEYLSISLLTGFDSLKKQESLKAYNIPPLPLNISINLRTAREYSKLGNQVYQSPLKKFQAFPCWKIWKNQLQAFESVALQSTENMGW